MIINASLLKNAFVAFNAAFIEGFSMDEKLDWERFVMEVNSTTGTEDYGWLGASTEFREWLGERVLQSLQLHNYSITNKTFENTVKVPRDKFEDDQYGVFAPLMKQMGQSAKRHPAKLIYKLLKAGFETKCYDGQYFFDTDHPVHLANGDEGSVSNFGGGSGRPWYLMDDSQVMRPLILQKRRPYSFVMMDKKDDDNVVMENQYIYGSDARLNVGFGLWQLAYASKQTLNSDNFNAAVTAMQSLVGDNGEPLGISPKILLVHPADRAVANEVVKSERLADGATNTNRDLVDVIVSPWLV